MVSTRGVRYKFSEGERVLCYEPDPTKAKVLYDSKVLEVIESKDKRGRRTVEYLIHFQGWNSSWDRCVSEDFVLKDTEENRQLQRDLAEKSQLQLGAYLYRRERSKKGGSTSNPGVASNPAKRPRHGFSDDGSSSSTQPDDNAEEGVETADTDSSSASGSGNSGRPRSPPPNVQAAAGRAHITLPSALRDRLTFDYHLVVKRGRLSQLPATPCAAQILESFVKWFARAGAWNPTRGRHDPPQKPDMLDVSCRLNLVREVADGLRVYFDFILRGHLLYKQELPQYHEICGQFIDEQEECKKLELEGEEEYEDDGMGNEEEVMTAVEEDLKSPKIPEYSHLPPDPMEAEKSEGIEWRAAGPRHNRRTFCSSSSFCIDNGSSVVVEPFIEITAVSSSGETRVPALSSTPADVTTAAVTRGTQQSRYRSESSHHDDIVASKSDSNDKTSAITDSPADDNQVGGSMMTREGRCATRSGNVARRLRSHKSVVSQSENEEPTPSTSAGEPRLFETMSSSVGSSGSSLSECWARPAQAAVAPSSTRTPLSLLLDKVAKWQIIPREGTEHLPCRVYGAIHLARLFVKLPDFLNATQMPDFKLKLIVKHIDMFVQYLDEHSEWFGEVYYVADNMSRSH